MLKKWSTFLIALIFSSEVWSGIYKTQEDTDHGIQEATQHPLGQSVCRIHTSFSEKENSWGSGVALDPQWIATSYHVIEEEDASQFQVSFSPEESYEVTKIIPFPEADLAFVKLKDVLPASHIAPLLPYKEHQEIVSFLKQYQSLTQPWPSQTFFVGYGEKKTNNWLSRLDSEEEVVKALTPGNVDLADLSPPPQKALAFSPLHQYHSEKNLFVSTCDTSSFSSLHAFAAPGDSGGPLCTTLSSRSFVIGITSEICWGEEKPWGKNPEGMYSGVIKTTFASLYDERSKQSFLDQILQQDF